MSNIIEDRILKMKFDNDNFEKNVKTSLSSLENLNKSLDATESNGGMVKLSEGAEIASSKFSALEVVAIGALMRIGSAVADTGMRLAKSLSVDQIAAGWNKYEQKTTSVQTIMAATQETWEENAKTIGFAGTQMEFVSDQLEKLNWFTDETSFDFADMTNNIGKFTSNGVALTDAVTAMEGISTWAALSGQNAEAAGRAMYNLAQAMSVGSVKLMDWKSIENANMATQEFKQTALETAVELGTLKKVGEGAYETIDKGTEVTSKNFNTALSEGWFTSDVLMKSLEQYGNAAVRLGEIADEQADNAAFTTSKFLSGLRDYDEGKKSIDDIANDLKMDAKDLLPLFEELSSAEYELGVKAFRAAQEAKTFSEAIDATKDAVSTSWMNIFETIFGNYEEAKILWTDVANWLYDVFALPLANLQTLFDGWAENGGRARFLQALYNLMDIVTRVIDTIKEAFHDIFPEKTSQDLINWTRNFMILTNNILKADDVFENIKRTLRGFFALIDIGITIGKTIFTVFKSVFDQVLPASKGILNLTGNLGDALVKFSEWLKTSEKFKEAVEKVANVIAKVVSFILNLRTHVRNLIDILQNNGTIKRLKSTLQTIWGYLKNIAQSIGDFFSRLTNNSPLEKVGQHFSILSKVLEIIVSLASKLAPIFVKIGSALATFAKTGLDSLINFINSLDWSKVSEVISAGLGAALIKFLWGGNGPGQLLKTFGDVAKDIGKNISGTFESLGNALGSLEKNVQAQTIYTIAKAVAILVASLVVLSMIDEGKIYSGIAAIGALITELVAAMSILAGADSPGFWKGVTGLMDAFSFSQKMSGALKFAAAVGILAVALALLSTIEPERLLVAMGAITILIGEMIAAMEILSNSKSKVMVGASAMIPFAMGILILSAAVKIFSKMSWEELAKGMAGFTVIIGSVVGASIALSKTGSSMLKGAAGMIPFAIGITIMAAAFKIFATMSWEDLAKSMLSFVTILGVITGMTIAITKVAGSTSLVIIGAGLVAFALGVTILSAAMKIFATMSWDDILRGMVALAGALGVITGMTAILSNTSGKGSLAAIGAGMVVFALGLAILVPVLKSLASMSWGDLAKAGAALAGLFTILGLAGLILKPVVPTIMALAGALALVGVACALAGAGFLMLGAGLSAIGASLSIVGQSLLGLIESVIAFVPKIVDIVVAFLSGVLRAIISLIGEYAPELMKAAVTLIKTLCESLIEAAPTIFETLVQMLDMLINYVPQIVEKVADLIIKVIDSLSTKMPEFLQAIFRFLQSMFGAVGDLLGGLSLVDLTTAIAELAGAALALAFVGNMGTAALKGAIILAGVIGILGLIVTGIGALVSAVPEIKSFLQEGIPVLEQIGQAIGGFLGNLVGSFMAGISNGLPQIAENLSAFMTALKPFLDGFAGVSQDVGTAAVSIAEAILALTAANLLDSIATFITGKSNMAEFAAQIVPFGQAIVDFSNVVAGNIEPSAVESAANAGKMLAEMAATLPNSGGVAGFFAGENDLDTFTEMIVPFGDAIAKFSATVDGKVEPSSVEAAANAGKMLAEMATTLPNSGGVLGFFAGNNDLDDFTAMIVPFGKAIKSFSAIVDGNVSTSAVESAVNAGKMLAGLADTLPNSGGVIGFFTGTANMADFALQIVPFARAIKAFSDEVTRDKGISMTAITAATISGKVLATLYDSLPKTGGVFQIFSGAPNLATFGRQLKQLGAGMAAYSDAIQSGSRPFSSVMVTASGIAAQSLAKIYDYLPNINGLAQKITGTKSLSTFADDLGALGEGMAAYSSAVGGEDFDPALVEASALAAQALATLYDFIPPEGGWIQRFTGISSMNSFSADLEALGSGLASYANSISGVKWNKATILFSANVAQTLATVSNSLTGEGGTIQKIVGESSLGTFADNVKSLGSSIADYGNAVSDATFDTGKIDSSVSVVEALAEAAKLIGNTGGLWQDLFGSNASTLGDFSNSLETFATGLCTYAEKINEGDFSNTSITLPLVTTLANACNMLVGYDAYAVSQFGIDIATLANKLVEVSNSMTEVNGTNLYNFSVKIRALLDLLNDIANVSDTSTFISSMQTLAGSSILAFTNAFDTAADTNSQVMTSVRNFIMYVLQVIGDEEPKFKEVGSALVSAFISMFSSRAWEAYNAGWNIGGSAKDGIRDRYSDFLNAGDYVTQGFVNGMTSSSALAKAYQAGVTLGNEAKRGEADATDSHSPSREFEKLGRNNVQGLANGMVNSVGIVNAASATIGNASLDMIHTIIAGIASMIESDMDCNPTIRPVLDTSNIQNGIGYLNSAFGDRSIAVGAVSGRLSQRIGTTRAGAAQDASATTYNNPVYNMTVNVTGTKNMDEKALAREISNRMKMEVRRQEATWA